MDKKIYWFHGDIVGDRYYSALADLLLPIPGKVTATIDDIFHLKVQLHRAMPGVKLMAPFGALPGPGYYRPPDAPNLFARHPAMALSLRAIKRRWYTAKLGRDLSPGDEKVDQCFRKGA